MTKRVSDVLVETPEQANAASHDEAPYTVHAERPLIRRNDSDLDDGWEMVAENLA